MKWNNKLFEDNFKNKFLADIDLYSLPNAYNGYMIPAMNDMNLKLSLAILITGYQ